MAAVLRPIVQIQNQFTHLLECRGPLPNPRLQAVRHEVAAHLGVGEEQRRFGSLRLENAERRQHAIWLEVMVCCPRARATVAATREGADGHGGLGIQGQPQRLRLGRCLFMHRLDVGEDRLRLLHFFWGRHLATLRSRKPKAFNFSPIVCTLGSCSSV